MSLPIRRQSWEIVAEAVKRLGADRLARAMNLSKQTIYKWMERSGMDEELPFEPSGRPNPLDRTAQFLRILVVEGQDDLAVESMNWINREGRGIFISTDDLDAIKKIIGQAEGQSKPHLKNEAGLK